MKRLLLWLALTLGCVQAIASTGTVFVSLSEASVCFARQCVPALLGDYAAPGTYRIQHSRVLDPAYGGDVLAFAVRKDGVPLAIHRVWLGDPKQRRLQRLAGPVEGRKGITGGCVNVLPVYYQQIVDCCSRGKVIITP